MEGNRRRPSPPPPPAAAAAAMSAVLGNDDLLREILLRLGFPTTLVRAALVCKRWFGFASDPSFLCRFRELHPPGLLGFYVAIRSTDWMRSIAIRPQFVPMQPLPPELACVLRRASFRFDNLPHRSLSTNIMDCRNGSVLFGGESVFQVHSPLYPERGMVTIPLPPYGSLEEDTCYNFGEILSKEGTDGAVYFCLSMEFNQFPGTMDQQVKVTARVYLLQDGGWHIHTSATIQLPEMLPESYIVLAHDKIYMAATTRSFLVLDMTSSSFSTIELPDGLVLQDIDIIDAMFPPPDGLVFEDGSTMLSPADDSGVYLIHVKGLQLNIWLHKGNNCSFNSWLLVDAICLREMCDNLKMSNLMTEDDHTAVINIFTVGDNAEFVFLMMGKSLLYLDLKSRELRKVYEHTAKDRRLARICPFSMVWPPIFPELQD